MNVSDVSSSGVMDIYAQGVRVQSDEADKLALIALEQKMKADEMELAQKALGHFYA